MNYINEKIMGLPKPLRKGHRTGYKCKRHYEYVHKVCIKGYDYFKVHVKRQGKSKIKYFKTLEEAKFFVDVIRESRFL